MGDSFKEIAKKIQRLVVDPKSQLHFTGKQSETCKNICKSRPSRAAYKLNAGHFLYYFLCYSSILECNTMRPKQKKKTGKYGAFYNEFCNDLVAHLKYLIWQVWVFIQL